MIMDSLEHLSHYIPQQYQEGILDFITQLSPDMEEKRYDIYGSHVFAKVMSYDTKERQDCRIEAHNCYTDIQASIAGAETIDIFDRKILRVKKEEHIQEDTIFFYQDHYLPFVTNHNVPGMFSMIFPGEAHRPQQKADGYENYVKKFVIKIEAAQFYNQVLSRYLHIKNT